MCARYYCAELCTHIGSFNPQDMPMIGITVPQNRQGLKRLACLRSHSQQTAKLRLKPG